METLNERQQALYEWLQSAHNAAIEEIQERYAVSPATAYRDARALVQAGLALKTSRGIRLTPPAAPEPSPCPDDRCAFCGGAVNLRAQFVIEMQDGSQRTACCPHCGMMAFNTPGVASALACDFLYGRMVSARQATFLLESSVSLCCQPSLLCFASQDEARRFQLGFGGQLCTLEQAAARVREIMSV